MLKQAVDRMEWLQNSLSLRQQIVIVFSLLSLLIAIILSAGAGKLSRQSIEYMVRERMQGSATKFAQQLDHYMFERLREVRLLVEHGQDWTGDPQTVRTVLERLQGSVPDYAWLGFANAEGTIVSATKKMLEGVSVSDRKWFVNGLKKPGVEDVHEAVLLADLLRPTTDGEPLRFVDVAVPVKDARGETIGVVGAHLDWNWSSILRKDAAIPDTDASVTEFLILSTDGKILLGEPRGGAFFDSRDLAATRASPKGSLVDHRNDGFLTGYAISQGYRDYHSPGWIVVARRSIADAMAPAREIRWKILGLGLLAALSGVVVVHLLARRLAQPIKLLTSEADQVGREPGKTMLSRLGGSIEIVQLSTALRSLLRRVGVAEERTRAAEERELAVSSQAAIDLRMLQKLADTDPLTHLLNRRSFMSSAQEAMQYFVRYERSLAFLMLDIDHFKAVNDRYGHAAGDAVIRHVANIIASGIRQTDKAGRFGGEEFAVLLREVDHSAATALADRLRDTIQSEPVRFREFEIPITVSVGIAEATREDRDVGDVLERTDQALYMAKNTGRNRVFWMPLATQAIEREVA